MVYEEEPLAALTLWVQGLVHLLSPLLSMFWLGFDFHWLPPVWNPCCLQQSGENHTRHYKTIAITARIGKYQAEGGFGSPTLARALGIDVGVCSRRIAEPQQPERQLPQPQLHLVEKPTPNLIYECRLPDPGADVRPFSSPPDVGSFGAAMLPKKSGQLTLQLSLRVQCLLSLLVF